LPFLLLYYISVSFPSLLISLLFIIPFQFVISIRWSVTVLFAKLFDIQILLFSISDNIIISQTDSKKGKVRMKVWRVWRNECKGQRCATVYIFIFFTWKDFVSSSNYTCTCVCCSLYSRDRISFATKGLIHLTHFPSFHSKAIVSKVKGEFVLVNALKA
jgi:hypothetical protein